MSGVGVDGHNSHTNVCSAAARLGYALWSGGDRPSPDHANAKFILLLSSHLETGHYFNPHAQTHHRRQDVGREDLRRQRAPLEHRVDGELWLAPHPGTEPALILGFVNVVLSEGLETASSCGSG